MNFAVQRASVPFLDDRHPSNILMQLYYDTNVHATTAVLATFSTACFGYVYHLKDRSTVHQLTRVIVMVLWVYSGH